MPTPIAPKSKDSRQARTLRRRNRPPSRKICRNSRGRKQPWLHAREGERRMHLTPQDEDFFALFADQAHLVSIMSGLLLNEVTGGYLSQNPSSVQILEKHFDPQK